MVLSIDIIIMVLPFVFFIDISMVFLHSRRPVWSRGVCRSLGGGHVGRTLARLHPIYYAPDVLCNRNRNRNLKTSKALLNSQAHQGTSLFTSAATNQRGVSKGGSREAQVRIPEYQEGIPEYQKGLYSTSVISRGGKNLRFLKKSF